MAVSGPDNGLVGGDGLVHPGTQLGDAGIHTGPWSAAGATSPGHNANQGPSSALLAHQGTTRVTLANRQVSYYPSGDAVYMLHTPPPLTMQEETPEAPAQIIASEIWLPQ